MDQRASALQSFLQTKHSPLAPYAQQFVNAADKYGLDYRILPAISGIETSFGTAGTGTMGPFGYGSAKNWGSTVHAIDVAAKGLGDPNGYYKNARTISQVAGIWAPPGAANDAGGNAGWPSAVSSFFRQLGGDPNAPIRGIAGARMAAPTATQGGGGVRMSNASLQPVLDAFAQQSAKWAMDPNRAQDDNMESFQRTLSAVKSAAATRNPAGTTPQTTAPTLPGQSTLVGNLAYPLGAHGSLIGTPHSGTHTLGNWESDNAVDIGVPNGTPVYAMTNGTIGSQFGALNSSNPRMAGLRLHLNGGGNEYYYAHLSRFAPGISPGVQVQQGQLLGYSGSANGTPHLHLGWQSGNPTTIYR